MASNKDLALAGSPPPKGQLRANKNQIRRLLARDAASPIPPSLPQRPYGPPPCISRRLD